MQPQYHFHPMNDVLFETESKIIERLGKTEDCIIVGPVSYTHLDVYKRQPLYPAFPNLPFLH